MTPIEARDQAQIEMYGPRVGSTVTAHEICDEFTVGPVVAQLILQRALYVRAKYTFKLAWEFCLLEPMDVVSINDANLGLQAASVRIVSIEEDDIGAAANDRRMPRSTAISANPAAASTPPGHTRGR